MSESTSLKKDVNNKSRRRKVRKHNSYRISDEVLLYKIADAGLLCYLHGVNKDKSDPEKRVYFFDRHADVKEVIDAYKAENEAVSL